MMKKTSFEDVLILNAARSARVLFRLLPLKASLVIGRSIGRLVYFSSSKRRRIARQNLRAAFASEKTNAQLERISRESIEKMAMSIVEFLRCPELGKKEFDQLITVEGRDRIDASFREGRGVIMLTGHFGSWELMSVMGSIVGYPMMVLAREQRHPRSDEFLNSLRTSRGGRAVLRGMGIREILKSLKEGKILGIVSDQDGGKSGAFVRFFGRLSSTPPGVVTIAARTGSPIYPVFITRKGLEKHHIRFHEALEVPTGLTDEETERRVLQAFAEVLESTIREAPEQWLWAYKRWKSTPDRSILVLSDGKAGHLNQSIALLGAMRANRARMAPEGAVRTKIIEVRFKSARRRVFIRGLSVIFGGKTPFSGFFLKWVLTRPCYDELMRFYADAVISCGSSVADVNWMLGRENGSKSVVMMRPPMPGRFDAVVAPRHDGLKPSRRIFVTEGPAAPFSARELAERGGKLAGHLKFPADAKKIGLFVGGDAGRVKFSPEVLDKVLAGLERACSRSAVVLVTTSRRTPVWAEKKIKEAFVNNPSCPHLIIANEFNPEGSAASILGLSDVLVVSGESASMVSEAVSTGKPVIVFMPSHDTVLKKKHTAFLTELGNREWLRVAGADTFAEDLERALAMKAGPSAYDEANRAVLESAAARVLG